MRFISFFISIIFLFASCSQDEFDSRIDDTQTENVLSTIETDNLNSIGYDLSQITEITKNGVIIENDIYLRRTDLRKKAKLYNGPLLLSTQYYNMKYWISPSFSGGEVSIINSSFDLWEDHSALSFDKTSILGQADIKVIKDSDNPNDVGISNAEAEDEYKDFFNMAPTRCGMGWPPTANGSPSQLLSINDNFQYTNNSEFQRLVEHEIGHQVGFAHNNDYTSEVSFLECSEPANENENCTTILMQGICCSILTGQLSFNERYALDLLYPKVWNPFYIQSINQTGSGEVEINMSNSFITNKIFKAKVERFLPYQLSSSVQTDEFQCVGESGENETTTLIVNNVPQGYWVYKVTIENAKGDRELISNTRSINVN